MEPNSHDVIVIGSGAAGLTAALALAETRKVLVLAKGSLTGGSTAWAQGGIAAVLDAGDTFEDHIRDTMVAGAGLNRLETVEFVIENAPAAIDRLIELGVPFNKDRESLHLTREGGELAAQEFALLLRAFDEVLVLEDPQDGTRRRARERIAAEGRPVRPGRERAGERFGRQHRADRKAAAEALRERDGIGLHAGSLEAEPATEAADAGLNLVEEE